jgi:deoxyribonuclease-4
MLHVGVHVSIGGGVDKAVDRAFNYGATAFQIFTRNPRGWKYTPLKSEEVTLFREKVRRLGYVNYDVAHMPYLPNLSSPDDDIYEKSLDSLINELDRCGMLDIPYLVIHLGSHRGKGFEKGRERLVNAIEKALETIDNDVVILLENMAGQKNSMGSRFEEIRILLDDLSNYSDRIGICFDTAHAYAAGYDLSTPSGVDKAIEEFKSQIGFKWLRVIHLNDSRYDLASGRDVHEHIGLGYIGERGFRAILSMKMITKYPLILETPVDRRRGDLGNIMMVWYLSEIKPPTSIVDKWMEYIEKDPQDREILNLILNM